MDCFEVGRQDIRGQWAPSGLATMQPYVDGTQSQQTSGSRTIKKPFPTAELTLRFCRIQHAICKTTIWSPLLRKSRQFGLRCQILYCLTTGHFACKNFACLILQALHSSSRGGPRWIVANTAGDGACGMHACFGHPIAAGSCFAMMAVPLPRTLLQRALVLTRESKL